MYSNDDGNLYFAKDFYVKTLKRICQIKMYKNNSLEDIECFIDWAEQRICNMDVSDVNLLYLKSKGNGFYLERLFDGYYDSRTVLGIEQSKKNPEVFVIHKGLIKHVSPGMCSIGNCFPFDSNHLLFLVHST